MSDGRQCCSQGFVSLVCYLKFGAEDFTE